MDSREMRQGKGEGEMTVREAGQKGGAIGGRKTAETHGHDFYQEIGSLGGQKVKRLVEEGRRKTNGGMKNK